MTGRTHPGVVLVEQRPLTGRVVVVAAGATIGRDGCDVLVPDPEVSRMHAVLRVLDGRALIEDLGSTNGTWVNERRASGPVPLDVGDVVRVGNTVWRVELEGSRPAAATRVASG
jgi:pSer/pThr/pTyr-binding forkhead associated (FHA) protein